MNCKGKNILGGKQSVFLSNGTVRFALWGIIIFCFTDYKKKFLYAPCKESMMLKIFGCKKDVIISAKPLENPQHSRMEVSEALLLYLT